MLEGSPPLGPRHLVPFTDAGWLSGLASLHYFSCLLTITKATKGYCKDNDNLGQIVIIATIEFFKSHLNTKGKWSVQGRIVGKRSVRARPTRPAWYPEKTISIPSLVYSSCLTSKGCLIICLLPHPKGHASSGASWPNRDAATTRVQGSLSPIHQWEGQEGDMTICLSPVPGLETPKKPSEQGTSLATLGLVPP